MPPDMWYYCAVEECASIGKQLINSWFKFPLEDCELMKAWRAALNYPVTWMPLDRQCVCDKHFVFSDFVNQPGSKCRQLKPNAVPHIFNLEHRRAYREARLREASTINLPRHFTHISSKYELKDGIVMLERIDSVLNIPSGVTSGIILEKHVSSAWPNGFTVVKTPPKSRSVAFKRKRIRKVVERTESSEYFDGNMDMSPECMETLFTPETNLVEQELSSVSIWANRSNFDAQKKLFVVRNQLPAKLRHISADHLWIQDPVIRENRLKVHVVDASFTSKWITSQSDRQAEPYPVAITSVNLESSLDEGTAGTSSTLQPSVSNQSILSALLKRSVEPAGAQPSSSAGTSYDACSFGISHDHQYLGPTLPAEPKSAPPVSPDLIVVQMRRPPVPQVYVPSPPNQASTLAGPEYTEMIEARKRISFLEKELVDSRRQLSAARTLINRLRLADLAKSAQIRALQQAEYCQTMPLFNQVFEPTSFETFGQHFMAPREEFDPPVKMERA